VILWLGNKDSNQTGASGVDKKSAGYDGKIKMTTPMIASCNPQFLNFHFYARLQATIVNKSFPFYF
jgi:hypothetical protein